MRRTNRSFVRRRFTLVEIIVAMGIFSIIMLMLFRLFAGSQKVWNHSEARSNRYADARVAMDLMTHALQSAFYAPETTVMLVKTQDSGKVRDNLTFPVKMSTHYGCMKENTSSSGKVDAGDAEYGADEAALFFIRFHLAKTGAFASSVTDKEEPGRLYLSTFGSKDNETSYKKLFTPYTQLSGRCNEILSAFEDSSVQDEKRKQEIIRGVTRLEFTPVLADYRNSKLNWRLPKYSGGDDDTLDPVAMEIKLWLLDSAGYDKWYALNDEKTVTGSGETDRAKEFRRQNEYLFTRLVYMPNNR